MTSVVARQPTTSRCNSPRPHRQHARLHTTYVPKATHHDPIGSGRKGERRISQGSRKFDQPNEGQLRADRQQPLTMGNPRWPGHEATATQSYYALRRAIAKTSPKPSEPAGAHLSTTRMPGDRSTPRRPRQQYTPQPPAASATASRPTSRRRRQPEKTRHTERSHTTEHTPARLQRHDLPTNAPPSSEKRSSRSTHGVHTSPNLIISRSDKAHHAYEAGDTGSTPRWPPELTRNITRRRWRTPTPRLTTRTVREVRLSRHVGGAADTICPPQPPNYAQPPESPLSAAVEEALDFTGTKSRRRVSPGVKSRRQTSPDVKSRR